MKFRNLAVLLAATVLVALALTAPRGWKATAATLEVDDNNIQCPTATFASIQAAVDAAGPGDTIQVCAGIYNEDVNVPATLTGLTLNGAQAGTSVTGRTAGSPVESTVNGEVTIRATNVKMDGFSITHTESDSAVTAITVNGGADGAMIVNNILDTIVNTATGNSTAQAIYLSNDGGTDGPDNVSILDNRMSNISSNRSAKGVLIGANGGTNPSVNTLIQGNSIQNVNSIISGAYGVSVATSTPGVTGLEIRDNDFNTLTSGGWVHAVGLEGNTPGAIVDGNDFTNLVNSNIDNVAVFFQSNPSFATVEVHNNNFNLTTASFGIALHPALVISHGSLGSVDGACNWWNSPTGPTAASNPGGTGTKVGSNVSYEPWLIAPAPGGACLGGNVPTNKNQCKNGGWMTSVRSDGSTFKNQGDCVSYTNNGK
ncbi:MAG: hypothetical protein AABN95_12610 [Acidobacteriota bacterium]